MSEIETEPTVQTPLTEKVRPFAAAGVLVAVATLGFAVAQSTASFFSSVRVELSDNAKCCESFKSYKAEDSAQRAVWIQIIRDIQLDDKGAREQLAHLAERLARLESLDQARHEREAHSSSSQRDIR